MLSKSSPKRTLKEISQKKKKQLAVSFCALKFEMRIKNFKNNQRNKHSKSNKHATKPLSFF